MSLSKGSGPAQDESSRREHRRVARDGGGGGGGGVAVGRTCTSRNLPGDCAQGESLRGLNDRLAGFIEKVRELERHNRLLEGEIEELRGKAKPASRLEQECGPELSRLRDLVRELARQKRQIEVEHLNLEEELRSLSGRCEKEARGRSDAERNVLTLKRQVGDAFRAKEQLEQKARGLLDEIHLLRRDHDAEVCEMLARIQSAQAAAGAHERGDPGVTAALREIRSQLEDRAAADAPRLAPTAQSSLARLTEEVRVKREALEASRRQIQESRRRLQAKDTELDCAKSTREALEKQINDVQDHHEEEALHYQNTIKELENELMNCKLDVSGCLREFQDLLDVKTALDVEIMSYRKLLCGEEARLSTMPDTHISLPYIYHQSPVYSLPCLRQPGDPRRRAEPQYKFVEEIITETTREIEMSEYEETTSEETEAGRDEQRRWSRRNGGASEEEEEEEEGEQAPDGQQLREEPWGNVEEEGDGLNAPSEVWLAQGSDEKVGEDLKEGEDAEGMMTGVPLGAEDATLRAHAEGEPLAKPADAENEAAEKNPEDVLTSAGAQNLGSRA